jgi:hypothetical protein
MITCVGQSLGLEAIEEAVISGVGWGFAAAGVLSAAAVTVGCAAVVVEAELASAEGKELPVPLSAVGLAGFGVSSLEGAGVLRRSGA